MSPEAGRSLWRSVWLPLCLWSLPRVHDLGQRLPWPSPLSEVSVSVFLSIVFRSHLWATVTLLNQHSGCLHPPSGGWAARPTPQDHGHPALASRRTAVAEDEWGWARAGDVEGGTVAKAELILEVDGCASGLGEHLGPESGRRVKGRGVQGQSGENKHPSVFTHLERHGCLGSNPDSASCWLCDSV